MSGPRVTVFGPHPLLTVTVERQGERDDVHLHAGGQGVWVGRMAAELGACPVLCGFIGGETGGVLRPLLDALPTSWATSSRSPPRRRSAARCSTSATRIRPTRCRSRSSGCS